MKKLDTREWARKVIKELKKHADRDSCYGCKELLRSYAEAFGISIEEFNKMLEG